jgi:hypothetical protein
VRLALALLVVEADVGGYRAWPHWDEGLVITATKGFALSRNGNAQPSRGAQPVASH